MAVPEGKNHAWTSSPGSEAELINAASLDGAEQSHAALPPQTIPHGVAQPDDPITKTEEVETPDRTEVLVLRGKTNHGPRFNQSKSGPESRSSLRPSRDILNRIEWDSTCCNKDDVVIGYLDRHDGILEIDFSNWKKDTTDEEFIPQHRIRYVKQKSDGSVLWDRGSRIDRIFGSGHGRGESASGPKVPIQTVELLVEVQNAE